MKKFITLVTIASMFILTSCGSGSETPNADSTSCDSTACADSCKVDTTAVAPVVDSTATITDTTSTK